MTKRKIIESEISRILRGANTTAEIAAEIARRHKARAPIPNKPSLRQIEAELRKRTPGAFASGSLATAALPSTIRIGAFDWKIDLWDANQAAGQQRWGEASTTEMRISVLGDMPSPRRALDVFMHEVSHAILTTFHVDSENVSIESVCCAFGSGLTMLFRDNPWLPGWLEACAHGDDQ